MHLKHISTPSINHTSKDNLAPFINCSISKAHKTLHTSIFLQEKENTQNCEHQMPFTGIWLNFRLKELFVESKNMQIGVQTRKLWSSEVEAIDSHGCAKIVQTPKPSTTPTANTRPAQTINNPGSVPGLIIHDYEQAGCPATPNRNQGYTRVAKRSIISVSKHLVWSLTVNKHSPKIIVELK